MTITLNGTTGISNDGGYIGDGIVFANTTPANTLVTDTSGNVGVGTASPGARLQVNGGAVRIQSSGTEGSGWSVNSLVTGFDATGGYGWITAANATVRSNLVVRSGGGNLLVGTTTSGANAGGLSLYNNAGAGRVDFSNTTGGNTNTCVFYYGATPSVSGSIQTAASSVSYNTSSDYRLKEQVQPMTGALVKVAALKPVTYKWKVDGADGEGFIAHELQEVVPACVTGEKDAVETYTDDDGVEQTRPVYQGIDTSFLVATLTAAIQELKAIVDAQGAEIAALKGTSNV